MGRMKRNLRWQVVVRARPKLSRFLLHTWKWPISYCLRWFVSWCVSSCGISCRFVFSGEKIVFKLATLCMLTWFLSHSFKFGNLHLYSTSLQQRFATGASFLFIMSYLLIPATSVNSKRAHGNTWISLCLPVGGSFTLRMLSSKPWDTVIGAV